MSRWLGKIRRNGEIGRYFRALPPPVARIVLIAVADLARCRTMNRIFDMDDRSRMPWRFYGVILADQGGLAMQAAAPTDYDECLACQ